MKHLKRCIVSCVFATMLTTILLTAEVAESASLGNGKWLIVRSPNAEYSSTLSAVAALSSTDIWAVGFSSQSSGYSQTLTEHWNGSSWTVVASPNVGSSDNALLSIVAVSANDIWAVGYSGLNTLTEHWNGSSWLVVASPNMGLSSTLSGVTALSTNDIWAVGNFDIKSGGPERTLTEHWNGGSWTIVKSPNVAGSQFNALTSVAALSPTDIWAVGISEVNYNDGENLTEHWNGSHWTIVPSPNAGSGVNGLNSVALVSATDVWAVGFSVGSGIPGQTVAEHWNGSNWTIVKSPNVGSVGDGFSSVTVVSATDIWAVGGYSKNNGFNTGRTLTEHWNGSTWLVVKSPNAGNSLDNNLSGAASIPGSGDIWAVGSDGYSDGMGPDHTLTEFHD